MGAALRFAGLYASIVFAFGFVAGATRVMLIVPTFGPFWSVLAELPVMLALSFLVARRLVRRSWPLDATDGLKIAVLSFTMLQLMESALAGVLGSGSLVDNLLVYWEDISPARLVGLAGQVLFSVFPLFIIVRLLSHERS